LTIYRKFWIILQASGIDKYFKACVAGTSFGQKAERKPVFWLNKILYEILIKPVEAINPQRSFL
jgi:hypothetical protein